MLDRLLSSETRCSLLDQCVVSGGNFLTTLVLARLLAPAEYGTFSLLFLSLFAINTCHTSLVVYPLTLRGAAASERERGELAGAALVHTLLLGIPLAAVLSIVVTVLHRPDLWMMMAIAMVLWQAQEAARRTLLAASRSRAAILPDFVCYVGQAVALAVLHSADLRVIFVVVAVTSLIAACWQFSLAKVSFGSSLSMEYGRFAWSVGRFALAGNSLNMIALQIPGWTLMLLIAPAAVAGYQSLLNLVGVANPIIFSVSNLLIPAVARVAPQGVRQARRTVVHYGIRYTALLLPCFVLLFAVPHLVMRLVYGAASPYLNLAPLLRPFAFAFLLQYLATVVGAYEGGMARPKTYMWVQIVSTGILLTAGVALIRMFSITGAVEAMVLASAARLVTFLLLARAADRPLFTITDSILEPSHD
jgi:O-antigen/teichoic acid export membrane protein